MWHLIRSQRSNKVPFPKYKNKKIYVWFEAVCGYLSMSKLWAKQQGDKNKWKDWWKNKNSWHYYVHGKDNIPFHTIFWPVILISQNLHLPDQIVSSEYLSLEGKQFSTSRNWAVWLPDYLKKYPIDPLRYYLIINGPENHDADFNWKKFKERNNSELLGTYGNFVHRVLTFTGKSFDYQIPKIKNLDKESQELLGYAKKSFKEIGRLIEKAELIKSLKKILSLAQKGNQYINQKSPWKENNLEKKAETLYTCLQLIYNLSILFYPFIPKSSERLHDILNIQSDELKWKYSELKSNHPFEKPKTLFEKIE